MNVEVTSVSKSKQRIADAPAAVTVITQDDIQRSGLHEIPEILRLAPGLFVQRGTQFASWAVASRGLPYDFNNNLLVLQDGRTLYTPIFGGVVWNTVDYVIPDLDRIEVIRGPGATLWGANAVNGVINITSKSAKDTQGLLVDSRLSSDDSDAAVRYGGKIDKDTYYRVYIKRGHLNDMTSPEGGDPGYAVDSERGGFRIDRYASSQDVLTLQGDLFETRGENSFIQPLFIPPFSAPGHQDNVFTGGNVLARWTHTVSETNEFSLQAYLDRLNLTTSLEQTNISTFDLDFQHHLQPFKGNDVIYGFGARVQPFQSESPGDGLSTSSPLGITWDQNMDLSLFSAFLQDTITLIPDRFKLTLGSKLEYNSLTQWEVEPSARLMFTPNETNSIWAGVSRTVRTPGMDNRTFHFPVAVFPDNKGSLTEITFAGNHDNGSEHMISYELGYRSQVTKAWGLDIAGFLDEHEGLLVAQQQAPITVNDPVPHTEIISKDVNGTDTENYGVEISSNLQVNDHWRLNGSYSLLISHVVSADPNTTLAGTYYEGPRNQFQLHSYYDITKNLQFNTSFYYVDKSQSGDIPNYTRLDGNITWTPKPGVALQVGVQNATDPQHPEFLRRSGAQSEIETAFYAQMTLKF